MKIAQKKRESALDAKFPMNDYVDFWGKVKVKGHVGFWVIELIWERFFFTPFTLYYVVSNVNVITRKIMKLHNHSFYKLAKCCLCVNKRAKAV